MEVEKNIAFFIKEQFPGIYKENGPELVALVEDYYKFLETQSNQSLYVSRRLFEYRDVDTTLAELLLFFKNKFLHDLPLKENTISFIVKNVLDLYRRKGTPAGIELFFSIFFQEFDIDIVYPADKMMKVSNSKWRRGIYLQIIPNDNRFTSVSGKTYTYLDLISKNIEGSTSGAKAAVSKVNFIMLNGIKTPIIYIDEAQGNFERYDEVIAVVNGESVVFGRVAGSLSAFEVDQNSDDATVGNSIGDQLTVASQFGNGGECIVTDVSNLISGDVRYTIADGGYGYTIDNTRLQVSTQTLLVDNPNLQFIPYERLRDSAGNEAVVIGQTEDLLGVKSQAGDEFDLSRTINTLDRDTNFAVVPIEISPFNASSPGPLYPDGGDTENDVIVGSLTNTSQVSIITDLIAPHISTQLDAADYEATAPMSGTVSPVTLTTPLNQAFNVQPFTIGRIGSFNNIRKGSNYQTQVFARAEDEIFSRLQRRNQVIRFDDPGEASTFSVGETITQDNTSVQGLVQVVDNVNGFISVLPFDYYGFNNTDGIIKGQIVVPIAGAALDYDRDVLGDNAQIDAITDFAVGKIKEVAVSNSGFGYVDSAIGTLRTKDTNEVRAGGTIRTLTQGKTAGYWSSFSSHLNGYKPDGEYYEAGMRVQDSDFFQEYSYQIKSSLAKSQYESLLRDNVHLAGTKMFGDFMYKVKVDSETRPRFYRKFNDDGVGSPFDTADVTNIEASVTNYTVDSTYLTVDHIPGGTGGLVLTNNTTLDITKNWSQGLHVYSTTVQLPSSGSGPFPVAILLHGNGGNGAAMVSQFTSDLPGHILIGVDGYQNSWNISNESSNGPDIEMLTELVSSIQIYANVDDTKIRIVGTSNGGALALRAAVEISDPAIDTIVCMISQTNTDQYRNGQFHYPFNEELTGDTYLNDGYDTPVTTIPQRRLVQMNGVNDTVVPYNGGTFVGMTFLTAPNSAYRYAGALGFGGVQSTGVPFGNNSNIVDYGNTIFMNDNVGHTVSPDMRVLLNNYLEDNYKITY